MSRVFHREAIQNFEAEQALLGAILHTNPVFHRVANIVRPEDFADPLHGRIFEAIGKLVHAGQTATPVMLKGHFAGDPAMEGNQAYLAQLANSMLTILGVEDFAKTIRDLADRRRIVAAADEAIAGAQDVNLDLPATQIAAELSACLTAEIAQEQDFEEASDVAARVVDGLRHDLPCYSTGLPGLDYALGGGFYPGRVYGFGGRYGDGKSMLMNTISYAMHWEAIRHAYFCLEMKPEEQMQRLLGRLMGINSLAFIDGDRRTKPWFVASAGEAAVKFRQIQGLIFQPKPRMSLEDLRHAIARAVMLKGVKGVFVDYMQLVTGQKRGQSMAEHWDNVAQTFAELAKQYDIWVATAVQLNRDGDVRGGDGLLMACDDAFLMQKVEFAGTTPKFWLKRVKARSTAKLDIGSESDPAYELHVKAGPYFRELHSDVGEAAA